MDEAVDYQTHPDRYAHWKLGFDGPVARLTLDVQEDRGIRAGYKLKLNSYDLGVDIELHDALQRIRFEHPEVRGVVITSGKERIFCSGANIFMLGLSSHAWKVNFCKFTNETRNGIEDASRYSGLKFIAACNGTTAGGGYELALACDEIFLVDDRSSAVSLPEVPLLGVLPGTGGLTRLTDKRKVRHDLADIFCTTTEGVRGARAQQWRLVDAVVKSQQFATSVQHRALELASQSDRPDVASGAVAVVLFPLNRIIDDSGYHYGFVDVAFDRAARRATLTVSGPSTPQPATINDIVNAGCEWWPLAMARELDDAILMLRTNQGELGTWLLKTRGDIDVVLAIDAVLETHRTHWFVRETIGLLRRTLARLDVSSRTLFALIEPGSCFAGTLLELALAADRSYMASENSSIALSPMNFGSYPRVDRLGRIEARFYREPDPIGRVRQTIGTRISAQAALESGLITVAPDALDWSDEIRIALEERASLSPDALTGMEANLRFGVAETMETRVFGRLSAWQNWIFTRPNAVGESGALKVYGSGKKARFDWERV
ncbi:MAG: benzoyl-CoA-dihydrodiol lyase [Burkholderiaceae bacterium]|nr:benzoyl-CoA-dihydrodiol lyase [Burkholderiaceae bacterium]